MWLGDEDNLPRFVYATYLDNANEPSYIVEFSDWKLNEPVPPETFTFLNKSKAAKVEFRTPSAFKVQKPQETKSGSNAGGSST
jgi:hypothetical protein